MDQKKLAKISTEYIKEILILCESDNEKVAGVIAANIALLVSIHHIDINAIFSALTLVVEHLKEEGIIKEVYISPAINMTLQ